MKVFKFGGASVKDASGVKNLIRVLETTGYKDTLVVVSAMGKTTNALENIIETYFDNKQSLNQQLLRLKEFHLKIVEELFEDKAAKLIQIVHDYFDELKTNAEKYLNNRIKRRDRYNMDEFERFVKDDIYSICGKKPIIKLAELE